MCSWDVCSFLKHIDRLFQIIADDISGIMECGGAISISSIHPSVKRRNLIDLQQSLQISGAFEFYVRRYLPAMVKEERHHIVMKMILDSIACRNYKNMDGGGKLKKLAKSLSEHVVQDAALKDMIEKAYKGYDGWEPLKPCISEEWFPESEISDLAKEANIWRNELAHSKRSYEPSEKTIKAVRLLEHINYAIVLREIGYEDDEIQQLLEAALRR